jgi:polyprenyl P-hydroxybenzoate/phenylacrylic acid decarboxylase-like protein
MSEKQRIIIGISGASGAIYGVRILQYLQQIEGVETHLVISKSGQRTLSEECGMHLKEIQGLADVFYPVNDIGAAIASGSFKADGMVIAPCSVRTMSAIATGVTDNLLTRAADVCLKERRKLVLMVRETPFHLGHLRTMTALAEMGAIIAPPLPAFYPQPKTLEELVEHSVGRVLDLLDIPNGMVKRWEGAKPCVTESA